MAIFDEVLEVVVKQTIQKSRFKMQPKHNCEHLCDENFPAGFISSCINFTVILIEPTYGKLIIM